MGAPLVQWAQVRSGPPRCPPSLAPHAIGRPAANCKFMCVPWRDTWRRLPRRINPKNECRLSSGLIRAMRVQPRTTWPPKPLALASVWSCCAICKLDRGPTSQAPRRLACRCCRGHATNIEPAYLFAQIGPSSSNCPNHTQPATGTGTGPRAQLAAARLAAI